jgi:hypothetical protein
MNQKYIQLILTDEEIELFKKRPSAFFLLCVVAKRAKRTINHPNKELQMGEAYLGDWETYSTGRQVYRTDLKFLEKHEKLTTRITNRGTIAKVVTTIPLDINEEKLTTNLTSSQPPANHQLTTNNNDKNDNKYITPKKLEEIKTSKNSLTSCTSEELELIANDLNVPLSAVSRIHQDILDSIMDGSFQKKKYGNTVYFTLRKWVRRRIDKGELSLLNKSRIKIINSQLSI